MDNIKMPFIPEETLKTQRVEVYLNDLKERLNGLRLQHNEVVHNSVEIIKEIDQVSSTLLPTECNSNAEEHVTKIKKLIMEFEATRETSCSKTVPAITENHVDIRKILQNFEKLNESHLLKDSLKLFRKAKESFEKIDTFLDSGLMELKRVSISENIRDKINMLKRSKMKDTLPAMAQNVEYLNDAGREDFIFHRKSNEIAESKQDISQNCQSNGYQNEFKDVNCGKYLTDNISNYTSCCSSLTSINRRQSLCKNSLNGYEGDNDDSEFDVIL